MKPGFTYRTATVGIGLALLISSCQLNRTEQDSIRELTVLYTNDEHGWMEGMETGRGAAHLFGLWQRQEGYTEDGPFLILSGGDNFTGPAISTWVEGESMVEILNAMHYDAAAVGNHEFDFGLEELRQRTEEADYPYLSANTRWRENHRVPLEMGILPFTIKQVNDLRVGIIGLTTTSTPTSGSPLNTTELEFIDYETALRETVAEIDTGKLDLLFVIAHVCMRELEPLAQRVKDLNIDLMGGGHCNELIAREVAGTVLVEGGYNFTAYAKAQFSYDIANKRLVSADYSTSYNVMGAENNEISAIVRKWSDVSERSLADVLAYNSVELQRRSGELGQLVIDSWLLSDPTADIALTNAGGIRSDLPAGIITLSTLIGMMPFDNSIIAVNVSGAAIEAALTTGRRPLVAGLRQRGDVWILEKADEPLESDREYRVLLNSYMYAGGDNFHEIAEANPDGYDTGTNYRQPFLDWLRSQHTTAQNPLRF